VTTRVFLVPGFFGFTNLGDFVYFSHVRETLEAELAKRGIEADVHPLDTLPTKSIRERAARLLENVREHSTEGEAVHLVGHSTGGLDARLLAATTLRLEGRAEVLPRIRSVVTLATPHRGAPAAAFFTSLSGKRLLGLLSLSTVHLIRLGSLPMPALIFLGGALADLGAFRWASGGLLDQMYSLVLRDFGKERQKELEEFFAQSQDDQTLLTQLTPEAMELVDALAVPSPGVRCGSVVVAAPPPTLRRQASLGVRHPSWQAMYGIYRGLHFLSSTMPERFAPALTTKQRERFFRKLGWEIAPSDNDGMVPTVSQIWGEVIHVARADHMDVMGHFHGPEHHPRHVDWLRTGSDFGQAEFDAMLADVADFIARDEAPGDAR